MPDDNRAEAQRTPTGTSFTPQDPRSMDMNDRSYQAWAKGEQHLAKGGRVRFDDGGMVDDGGVSGPDMNTPAMRSGGRVKRAIGGVIPGPAPTPMARPMNRPATQAPMPGNALARGALSQAHSKMRHPMPIPMPGAPATAPMAAAPPPALDMQQMPGTQPQGMKKGGRTRRATGGLIETFPVENYDWTDRLFEGRPPRRSTDKRMELSTPHAKTDPHMDESVRTPHVDQRGDRYEDEDIVQGGTQGYARGGRAKFAEGGPVEARADKPKRKPWIDPGMMHPPSEMSKEYQELYDAPNEMGGYAKGGGIHIKKSHEGLLHKDLGVPAGQSIPAGKLASARNSSDPAVRKRATFAANAKKWGH